MEFNEAYRRQVALLIRTMPSIAVEECFAMKGGTAINLFVRDLPRLSVDIDLTYLPIQPRAESLAEIEAALLRIGSRIGKALPEVRVTPSRSRETNVTKLIVRRGTEQTSLHVVTAGVFCRLQSTSSQGVESHEAHIDQHDGSIEWVIRMRWTDIFWGWIRAA